MFRKSSKCFFFRILLKCACFLVLVGYIWFTLYSTVFARTDYPEYHYKAIPFWSYAAIVDGKESLIKENLLNVTLFVSVGFLLLYVLSQRRWWKALLFGFGFSCFIELLQLIWKRGTCEFDDVFHNTIGCLVGYFVADAIIKYCRSNL